ncbi:MAG: ChbG/HpnK family deacetylase [Desulfuromonadales bacterium]|nr:ChbG/HpnK family deacetylase [Desulfuromonadales bacterium]
MIRLIVNADDLGSGVPRDRGILAAFTNGIVTSASLLANGPGFDLAAREALACQLPAGVHLNLSEGHALTGVIAGLTDTAGNFPGKVALRRLLLTGQLNREGVRRELLAQIEHVRAAGITPDHLDTHQHCLLFPALTGIIAEVAENSGIRALRLPQPAEATIPFAAQNLAEELALYRRLAPDTRQTLHARKLWTPDGLWGMPLLNQLNEATLAATLTSIPAGTWEMMTHPGYSDAGDPFGGLERETELQALTAPAIRQLIAERQIELTSFGACACAC